MDVDRRRSARPAPLRRGAGRRLRAGARRARGRPQAQPLDVVRVPAAARPRPERDGASLRHRLARRGRGLSRSPAARDAPRRVQRPDARRAAARDGERDPGLARRPEVPLVDDAVRRRAAESARSPAFLPRARRLRPRSTGSSTAAPIRRRFAFSTVAEAGSTVVVAEHGHTIFSACGTLSSGSSRRSRCMIPTAEPEPGGQARDEDDDVLHVRLPLRHPRPPARRRAALHRRQPEPPDQQGRDLRQGRGRDHEADVAGAADAAAAAQGRERARRRRVRADLVGARVRDPDDAARPGSAPPTRGSSRFFTGRDQMQALTGLFARQFGTPNYAAHGGFCSVNMAAGMIYTIGGSFWEFGGPDLERAKLFVMIGTAEDHHSNPLKIAIGNFKRRGGRFISINPVRTGYSAIADEWIPIRPGTDGALFMALLHELIAQRPRRSRVPEALHQRAAARGARRRRARGHVRARPRPGEGPAGRRPRTAQQARLRQGVGHDQGGVPGRHRRGHRPRARRPLHARRRHPGRAVVPAPARPRRAVHAGVGGGDHRHRRRSHQEARARARRDGAAAGVRAADRLDRRLGARATRRRRRGRSRSTRCAAWRRTRTASRPCARSPC